MKASSADASQFAISPRQTTEPKASTAPKERASDGRHLTARNRARGGARHGGIDVGVVPHVERAGGTCAGGDADQRGDGEHGMHGARRRHQPDQRGEHHEEHHARLHQHDKVGDVAACRGIELGCNRFDRHLGHGLLTQGPRRSASDLMRSGASEPCAFHLPLLPHLMRGSVS